MHFFTSTSFFYTWHCNFPCEGPDFCAWSRVSIFWNLFRVEFWGRGLVRFLVCTQTRCYARHRLGWVGWGGGGGWRRSLHEHTWWMLRQHVVGLRLHTFRMLRRHGLGWVGWGGGGKVMTFLARAHMVDAAQDCCWPTFAHVPDVTKTWVGVGWLGWGWEGDDVPCTSTHGRCCAGLLLVYVCTCSTP